MANYNSIHTGPQIDEAISWSLDKIANPITANSLGAALAGEQYFKHYSALGHIGLSVGSETIEGIFRAMLANTIIRFEVGGSNAKIYPTQYGLVEFIKFNNSRFFGKFYAKETTDVYFCSAKDENNVFTFYGWSTSFLPLSGGTLAGSLAFNTNDPIITLATGSPAYRFRLYSGHGGDWGSGASLILQAKNATSNTGMFQLTAHDGATSKSFSGHPDGRLLWDGKELLHAGNAANFGGGKVATGTYSGTGNYGSSKANTLTPGWEPKAMMIFPNTDSTTREQFLAVFIKGQKGLVYQGGSGGVWSVDYKLMTGTTWGSTNISWYSSSDANWQMNISGQSYGYIIWG